MKLSTYSPIALFAGFIMATLSVFAQTNRPVSTVINFRPIMPGTSLEDVTKANIDFNTATIGSVANAQQLIQAFFQEAKVATPSKDFSCIIHVVAWNNDVTGGKLVVGKSNWYVFNPQSSWSDTDFTMNKRLFGVRRPYLLVIHLGVNVPVNPTTYGFDYSYTVIHRLPANVQHLKDSLDLFNSNLAKAAASFNVWALGTLDGNPPSDIKIIAAITHGDSHINLDTSEVKFDNEGLYRWDISIAFPITTYKQLQTVTSTSGFAVPANVNKRDVLLLGNFFLKPVDVKSSNFLAVPHLVGGISITSKPLHTAMAGIGWGPTLANFYVGTMILTEKRAGNTVDHHYKLAFGINLPLRELAGKLGLKSQIQ